MTKPGFYKLDPEINFLHYAPNHVYAPNFTLLASKHEAYSYPVEGWTWFDSFEEAEAALGLNGYSGGWLEFGNAIMADADIKALLNSAIAAGESPLAMGLAVGLGQAAHGDSRAFLGAWEAARVLDLVGVPLVTKVQGLATQYSLPPEFVAALAAPLPA